MAGVAGGEGHAIPRDGERGSEHGGVKGEGMGGAWDTGRVGGPAPAPSTSTTTTAGSGSRIASGMDRADGHAPCPAGGAAVPWSRDVMCLPHPDGVVTHAVMGSRYVQTTTFADGVELGEEYDSTGLLVVRRWRNKTALAGISPWLYEFGEPPPATAAHGSGAGVEVVESSSTPFMVRSNRLDAWEFKVRNLPYPVEVYNVAPHDSELVLRTSNKKFYKRWYIPTLVRRGLPLDASAIALSHDGVNTLTILYRKPAAVMAQEAEEGRTIRARAAGGKDGDGVGCRQQ